MTGHVFLSHTSDMAGYPEGGPFAQAALDAVGRAGMVPVDMRYFAARDGKPADYCSQRVRECEIYVAVIGFRYGSFVPGETLSYTELEFQAAGDAGIPRLVFLLEQAACPAGLADTDRGPVEGFRRRLRDAGLVVRTFTSCDRLELEVFHALSELASGRLPAGPPAMLVGLPRQRPAGVGQALDGRTSAPAGNAGAPTAAVHGLPRDTASFTGRAAELELLIRQANADLAGARTGSVVGVHAIDGMAGIGKTTLAVHAAHLLAPRFPDGQFFLPLHSHTPGQQPADPGSALGTLLLAAGITTGQIPDGVDARAMMWRNGIAGKRVLLVLDDAASHEQVRPLLPGSAGSLVLITSRRRLAALEEATSISLGTMPPDDAAELFGRLASRAEGGAWACAEIPRLCGYLPLAIRLIAGTLRRHPSWTVTDLAAELTTSKDRIAAMRAENISVGAAFGLSYQDLTPGPQQLFRRLGLHPGISFDVYAATALNGASLEATRDHLDELYDHHVITEPARGRYRLHDLIGEHARSLAAGDDPAGREAAAGRLLDYYLHVATAANRLIARRPPADAPLLSCPPAAAPELSTRDEAMTWLEAERANLLSAAQSTAAHARPVYAVWIPAQLSEFLRTRGYWDEAFTLHQGAVAVALTTQDLAGQSVALANLGHAQWLAGHYPSAAASLTQALGLCRDLGDQIGQAEALNSLGRMQIFIDDYPAATGSLTEALRLCRDLGDRLGEATALDYLGIVQCATADFPAASASLHAALALYRDLGDKHGEASALTSLGDLQHCTGDYQSATATLTQASGLCQDLGDRRGLGHALHLLGVVQHLLGDYQASTASLTKALAINRDLGQRHGLAADLAELGVVQHLTGEHAAAGESLAQAMGGFRDVGDRQGQAEVLNRLGALLAETSGPDCGIPRHIQALGIARDIGSPKDEADALDGIGRCHIQAGAIKDGITHLRLALEIYQRIGSPAAEHIQETLRAVASDDYPRPGRPHSKPGPLDSVAP